ncbi:MAG: NIL domain-containing protein [Planctomycetota bacterium]|jgi:ferredoxin
MQQSVILHFSKDLVDKPIVSHIVKAFDVEVNILQATITPEVAGHMFSILRGEEEDIGKALTYLKDLQVRTILPTRNLVWEEEKCVHCGACVGHCRSGALAMDKASARVIFDSERCIACELCIPACPYGAVESIGAHLQRQGEL